MTRVVGAGALRGTRTRGGRVAMMATAAAVVLSGCVGWQPGEEVGDVSQEPTSTTMQFLDVPVESEECRRPGKVSQACNEVRSMADELIEFGENVRQSRLDVLADRIQYDAELRVPGTRSSERSGLVGTWPRYGFELQPDSTDSVLHFVGTSAGERIRTLSAQGYEARITLTEEPAPSGGVRTRLHTLMWRALPPP